MDAKISGSCQRVGTRSCRASYGHGHKARSLKYISHNRIWSMNCSVVRW